MDAGGAAAPPPPDPQCASIAKRGAWEGGIIAQVRLKAWEAKSLVRLDWEAAVDGEGGTSLANVARVDGAKLVQRTTRGSKSGVSLTFSLGTCA
jgi:hypothetical protein